MIEESVYFHSNHLKLEGVLTYKEDARPEQAILLCAPHPNLGGDMDNNIITSLARVSVNMGFVSLRFNYRCVGKSACHVRDIAGKFEYWEKSLHGDNYLDAEMDAQAALNFLVSQLNDTDKIYIAGYSFGSIVGMSIGAKNASIAAVASISTPFGKYNLDYLQFSRKPKLFIYSNNDFATTEKDTLKGFEPIASPKTLDLIENSDHFYRTQEDAVSQKVCNFFLNNGNI